MVSLTETLSGRVRELTDFEWHSEPKETHLPPSGRSLVHGMLEIFREPIESWPTYGFLTQPRSADDFLMLRRACLTYAQWRLDDLRIFDHSIEDMADECVEQAEVYSIEENNKASRWISLAEQLFVLPRYIGYNGERFRVQRKGGRTEWRIRQFTGLRKTMGNLNRPEKKVCENPRLAREKIESSLYSETFGKRPVIFLGGKWRWLHSEQRQTIQKAYQIARGYGGIVAVSVESNAAIAGRKQAEGKQIESAPLLNERMGAVAALPWVDIVFPVDPRSENLSEIDHYYEEEVWGVIEPNFYVLGERDHPYFGKFADRCREMGVILLWTKDTAGVSATNLLGMIR